MSVITCEWYTLHYNAVKLVFIIEPTPRLDYSLFFWPIHISLVFYH